MSYSNKQLIRMNFPSHDFGDTSANEIISFRLPYDEHGNSQKGKLVNTGVMVTEAFINSAAATVTLGTSSTTGAFVSLAIPTGTSDADCYDVSDDTDAIVSEEIAKDTLIQMGMNAGTGTANGAVTGQGRPFVDVYVW